MNVLLTILLLLAALSGPAQSYSIIDLEARNHLKANTIYDITQDKDGFIWIGSNAGLIRYDGIEFKHFTISDGLTDNQVFQISIDTQTHVFAHNFTNKANYYYHGHLNNPYNNPDLADVQFTNVPLTAYYDQQNAFLLSKRGGNYFFYIQLRDGEIIFKEKIELPKKEERLAEILSSGDYFYAFTTSQAQSTIYTYHVYRKTELLKSRELLRRVVAPSNIAIHKGTIILLNATDKSSILSHYTIQADQSMIFDHDQHMDIPMKSVLSFQGELWATSLLGGALKLKEEGKPEHFLPDKIINHVFVDRDTNAWLGTEAEGLYYLRKQEVINLGLAELQLSKVVMSICTGEKGKVFIGFNKLAIAEIRNNTVSRLFKFKEGNYLMSRRVMKLIHLGGDSILCGSDESQHIIDMSGPVPSQDVLVHEMQIGSTKSIAMSGKGKYWVGTASALFYINRHQADSAVARALSKRTIALHIDQDSTLWIGTLTGLYNKKNNSPKIKPFSLPLLKSHQVNDIASWNNSIYLATEHGLCIIDPNRKGHSLITKKEGLSDNQCKKLIFKDRTLWVATSGGISEIQLTPDGKEVRKIQIYTTFDGLLSNDINDLMLRNDTMWVATNEGLSIFPLATKSTPSPPPTNIVWASTNQVEHDIYTPIQLQAHKNNITIAFSGMSFGGYQQMTYQYRLLPNNVQWSTTNEHTITFFELQAGEYTFEVRAVSGKRIVSQQTARLSFEVLPTFTQTWLFKIAVLIFSIAVLYFLFYNREKAIKKKIEFEKVVSRLELEAIKAQINPHFIYNSLNSIKRTVLKNDFYNAEAQLSLFARLIRQTLVISQLNFISLKEETDYLRQYLEMQKIRFKEKLDYKIEINAIPNLSNVQVPTMLIQPFVENAIKHGRNASSGGVSVIVIKFILQDSHLICTIEDNGPGLKKTLEQEKEAGYIPQGMRISSSREKAYNRLYNINIIITALDKKDISPTKSGTLIKLTIPQKKKNEPYENHLS